MRIFGRCWSCGREWKTKRGYDDAFCYGCRRRVCRSCVRKYGHGRLVRNGGQLKTVPIGAHGRKNRRHVS